MDSELKFQWPGATRPSADVDIDPIDDATDDPMRELHEARRQIDALEADRHAARLHIEQLQAVHEHDQEVIAAQRHRLLVLERQLESAQLLPAPEAPARTSWLDRLLGGPSPSLSHPSLSHPSLTHHSFSHSEGR